MVNYFNIRYEFDREAVHHRIAQQVASGVADYICVADGFVMTMANRDARYLAEVNGGMFSVCDSGYVPLYIKWIYGKSYSQYCGCDIFMDVVSSRKYRMIFLGTQRSTLDALRKNLVAVDPAVETMTFYELPFCDVEDFDYPAIARMIEHDGADIIWVALGAPKQETFMNRLKPHLKRGVMIAVGAVFKFYSGTVEKRAPKWMVRYHLEFVYRIICSPRKQIKRCYHIVRTLPGLLRDEVKRKKQKDVV